MSPVLLVARRDYFAYVGAWGFWLSLLTAPLIIAALLFGPILLARAEPPRVLTDKYWIIFSTTAQNLKYPSYFLIAANNRVEFT